MSMREKKAIREVKTGATGGCMGCKQKYLDTESKQHSCAHDATVAKYGSRVMLVNPNERPTWCPKDKTGKE